MALVTTKNVVLCADDDFLTYHSLVCCSKFLDRNASYICCQGLFWGYEIENAPFKVKYSHINYNNFNNDYDSVLPVERAAEQMRNYMYLSYSVINTEVIKYIYRSCYESGIKNYNLIELLAVILPALKGKIKTQNLLYNIREVSSTSSGATCEDLSQVMNDARFADEYQAFKKVIDDNINGPEREEKTNRIIESYLEFMKYGPMVHYPKPALRISAKFPMYGYLKKIHALIVNKFTDVKGKPFFLDRRDRRAFELIEKQILNYKHIYSHNA